MIQSQFLVQCEPNLSKSSCYLELQDPAFHSVVAQELVDGDLPLLTHAVDPVTGLEVKSINVRLKSA